MQSLIQFMPLILLIVIMYFLLIRPQKKREKQVTEMRNSVQVGDEVVTIGGICGKIVKTKDESLIIQVGADKVKFEIMRWAVSKVVNASDKPASSRKEKAVVEDDEAPKKALPKRMKKSDVPEELEEAQVKDEEVVTEEIPVVEAEIIEPEEEK